MRDDSVLYKKIRVFLFSLARAFTDAPYGHDKTTCQYIPMHIELAGTDTKACVPIHIPSLHCRRVSGVIILLRQLIKAQRALWILKRLSK